MKACVDCWHFEANDETCKRFLTRNPDSVRTLLYGEFVPLEAHLARLGECGLDAKGFHPLPEAIGTGRI